MDDLTNIYKSPNLSAIDFSSPKAVRCLVEEYQEEMFPGQDKHYIDDYFGTVADMFAGRYAGFQAMDTAYHDIDHTMQATLCLVSLLFNRHLAGASPRIDHLGFSKALIAILLHDIGYLKEIGDNEGTGAKYTHMHEKRSCRHARVFLSERGWIDKDIISVENLISCTGPMSDISKTPFQDDTERLLGQSVCTADFIGQMSDPDYVEKLGVLYLEFVENYRFQKIPEEKWPFSSFEDLLRKTPQFWEGFVKRKMTTECGNVWDYFENPITSQNIYITSVLRNMEIIEKKIAAF